MEGTGRLSVDEARRIRSDTIRVVVLANFAAAVVMFALLNILSLGQEDDDLRTSVISFVVVSAIAFPGAALAGVWIFRPIERWVEAGQPASRVVKSVVVGGPRLVAAVAFGFWVLTAAIIGTVEVLDGGPAVEGLREAAALLAAGVTSAALCFLLVERRARPLVAAVLRGSAPARSATLGMQPRLVLSWALGSGVPLFALIVGEVSIGDTDPRISPAGSVLIAAVGLVVGAVMTVNAVRSFAEPLAAIRDALAGVERGDLSVQVTVDDAGEVGRLQAGVNQMVAGLRQRQRLADLFGRHVGAEVAQRALREGVGLGGERRDASALFVDLRQSTELAASSDPEDVVAVLNRFFEAVVRVVQAEGGWVNKFEGDGALCVFGAPDHQPDHARRALRAGRLLAQELAAGGMRAAIGISSGVVVAGNVGSEDRYEYTVIGDPVNEAARLTEEAKETSGGVLAGGDALAQAGDEAAHWKPVGPLHLRGRPEPTETYRPEPA